MIAIFTALVIAIFVDERDKVLDHAGALLGAAVALNLAAMTAGFVASRGARLSLPQSTAVAIELGLHNVPLAVTVGTLVNPVVAIPAAVYSAVMLTTAIAFAAAIARRNVAVSL